MKMNNTTYTREEIKNMLLAKEKSYQGISKYIGYSKTYTYDCLNNYDKGSLEFWSYCLDVLEIRLKPENKALTLINLLEEFYEKDNEEEVLCND